MLQHTPKIAFTVITRTIQFVVLGTLISWIIMGFTVSRISCNAEAAMGCLVITIATIFFLLLMPFLFFWFGRLFAIKKALKSVYDAARPEVVELAARQVHSHKEEVIKFGQAKNHQLFAKLPFFVRMVLKRIDLNFITPALKQNPDITESSITNLINQELDHKVHLEASWKWFWILSVVMIIVSVLLSTFF